jgi:hypothetical protein
LLRKAGNVAASCHQTCLSYTTIGKGIANERWRKAYSEGFLRGPLQLCIAQAALSSSKQHFQQVALQPRHQALALRVPKAHIVLQQPRLRSMHPCFRVWLWLHLNTLASRHPFWARSSIYSLQ